MPTTDTFTQASITLPLSIRRSPSFSSPPIGEDGVTRRNIEFAQAALAAPPDVREEAGALLQDLADVPVAIPADSVFWVRGWSFL
jgi:hypothetical protein